MDLFRFSSAARRGARCGVLLAAAVTIGCAAPTRTLIAPPTSGDAALARIVVTRPSFAIGGMLDMIVFDAGDVVGGTGVVPRSALWCDWDAAARAAPDAVSLAAVVREHRICRVEIIATTNEDGSTKATNLIRPKQFRRLQSASADLKDLDRSGSICLDSPAAKRQHGVEVGQVGPGGQLAWYRRPGTLTIRILSPNAQPPYNFSGDPVVIEAGRTYTFEARHGVVRLLDGP